MAHPSDYLYDLRAKATEEGRLVTCVWEVTSRCNLDCRHCYHPSHEADPEEMGIERARALLEELAEAGFLLLVLTGGEPFARPDFWEILEEASRQEFAVRLLTNGTLLDRDGVQQVADYAPLSVDLSLYGQRRCHESITRAPGSFRSTCRTGRLLTQSGVKVTVKMPLMRGNLNEYKSVKEVSDSWDADLITDASIFCRTDGNPAPLAEQASERQLLDFLLRRAQEAGPYRPASNITGRGADAPMCSAGRSSIYIDSAGRVFPCVTWRTELGNLAKQSLAEVTASPEMKAIRSLTLGDLAECGQCRLARWCVRCPGLAHLEGGDARGASASSCRLAGLSQALDLRLQAEAATAGDELGTAD